MSPAPLSDNKALYLVLGLLGLVIVGYTLFVARSFLLGPSLMVVSPTEFEATTSPTITISGTTARVSFLSINDAPIPLAEDGSFRITRGYPAGYTVLVVRARDRFDREAVDTIRFINQPETHGVQTEESPEGQSTNTKER
ncbi:MAG: hypothetical protein AAB955_00700 [Patescibacteria group bacterium]